MFKLFFSDNWYKKAIKDEDEVKETTAGPMYLFYEKSKAIKESNLIYDANVRASLSILMRKLRVSRNLTIPKLATAIDVDSSDLLFIENNQDFKPPLRVLSQLSKFYNIPFKFLIQAAGVVKDMDESVRENVVKYAAESSSFEVLSTEEKKLLNGIVKVIQDKVKD